MDFLNFLKNNKLVLLSGLINVILVISLISILNSKEVNESVICPDNILEVKEEEKVEDNHHYFIEVKGAVNNPGVYEMNEDSILQDAITQAGGFRDDAYSDNINLSRKVSDELVIYVYTILEYQEKNNINTEQFVCECPTYDISKCTDDFSSEIVSSENGEKSESISSNASDSNKSHLININKASKEELMTLTGIGEAKANDIINYRNVHGNFKSIEEIKNVNGIKDATYNKIKDFITV